MTSAQTKKKKVKNYSKITSLTEYHNLLNAYKGVAIIIDYSATWCGPCRKISPVFKKISKRYSQNLFLKIDIDEYATIIPDDIESLPTFVAMLDGKRLGNVTGANEKELEILVAKYCTANSIEKK